MMERYGWAQGYLVRKYGSFRLIQFEPLVILFLLAALILLIVFRQIPMAITLVCFLFFLIPFAIFLVKTGSMKKALSYYRFSLLLLWFWNIGMFKGMAGKKR
jgi:signal peptidase I